MAHSPAFQRFLQSTDVNAQRWRDGKGYDLDAVEEMTDDERAEVVRMMSERQPTTWREVEVLIVLDPAMAEEALDRAEGNQPPQEISRTRATHKKKAEPPRTPAFKRFMGVMEKHIADWPDGVGYDIAAVAEMNNAERAEILHMLTHRG